MIPLILMRILNGSSSKLLMNKFFLKNSNTDFLSLYTI